MLLAGVGFFVPFFLHRLKVGRFISPPPLAWAQVQLVEVEEFQSLFSPGPEYRSVADRHVLLGINY